MARRKSSQPVESATIRQLLVAPHKGRIYDPTCGSGGMFVQSEKFVESHGGKLGDISIYGQESNAITHRRVICGIRIRYQ